MISSAIDTDAASVGRTGLSGFKSDVLDKDDFLSLLITQLQHQDPLKPTDSVEFTAQLAQFSSLEQLGNVNDNLKELQNFQASINNAQAVSLTGKDITAVGNFLQLGESRPLGCTISLENDAAIVAVSIYDSTGEFIRAFEGKNLKAGRHTLFWEGTDNNGNPMPNGSYTFETMAADSKGGNIQTTNYFNGNVDKVTFEDNLSYVISGDQKIALGDVVQVAAAERSDVDSNIQALAPAAPHALNTQQPQSSGVVNSLINGGK